MLLAEDGEAALEILSGPEGKDVAALVLDLVMPNLDGMGTLRCHEGAGLARPTIVQTSMAGIDTVVSAMRAGATDFCVKPVSFERLKVSLANALKLDAMEDAVRSLKKAATGTFTFDDMVAGAEMEKVMRLGRRAAASDIPVLIEGESGCRQGSHRQGHPGENATARQAFRDGQLRGAAGSFGGNASCSVTRRARSPGRTVPMPASSRKPTGARCSSTRWGN